jgi:hypothetical protein
MRFHDLMNNEMRERTMPAYTFKAHWDGQAVRLDEPFEIPPNSPLLVTVLSSATTDSLRQEWLAMTAANLAAAYGENEPDYSIADLKQ